MEKELLVPIVFLFGLVAGSFSNVCIYRLPRGESIVWPPSHCPHCDHKLGLSDLIPVLSYVFLRGRCRYCQGKISGRYAVVELSTALIFLGILFTFGASWLLFPLWIISGGLIITFFIDLEQGIVLDPVVLAIAAAGISMNLVRTYATHEEQSLWVIPHSLVGALGAAAVFLFIKVLFTRVFRREAMGWGDVTLAAAIGTFVPFGYPFLAFFLASVVGGFLIGVPLRLLKVKGPWAEIPFGPFMVVGAFAMLFAGKWLTVLVARLYGFPAGG